MQTFSLYVIDRRYTAPTLDFVTVEEVSQAEELAAKRLAELLDHLAVEIWGDAERLVRIERGARSGQPADAVG